MNAPSPPRRPSRLTWPVFSRLLGRLLAGLALVWVVALVAWPERTSTCSKCALSRQMLELFPEVGR